MLLFIECPVRIVKRNIIILRKTIQILLSTLLLISGIFTAQGQNCAISFCNEVLPLHEPVVVRYLDQALHRTGNSVLTDIRANAPKFFNVIDPILAHYQVPADFKYLCIAESSFTQNATSGKGAHGFWQFMPETARAMGLVVNEKIDERQNLRKSTAAACRYFRQLYHELGSWTLVAAAYNAGPTKMKEYSKINGNKNFYKWSIYSETRKYLYRVVAIKEMLNRPEIYASMLLYNTSLRVFLRNEGTLLGLVKWPTISEKSTNKAALNDIGTLSINGAIASGFENFVPLAFKRYLFSIPTNYSSLKFMPSGQKSDSPEDDLSRSGEPANQWITLPFYSRRRSEYYLLPAQPKIVVFKKIHRNFLKITA
jgi:membrane-bound lytic murein transglycosylase D